MSNINPAFEPFLWFAPKVSEPAKAEHEGLYHYVHSSLELDAPLICYLEYTAGESDTFLEPGTVESLSLTHCYRRNQNVMDLVLLSRSLKDEIEEAAMAEMRREAEQAKEPV